MNDHDDYLDVTAAYKEYDKAYIAWGRANDGKVLNPKDDVRLWRFGPVAKEPQRRAAGLVSA